MRRLLGTTFAVIAFLTLAWQAQAGDGKNDKDLIQGSWELVGVSFQGKDFGKKDLVLTFKGDKVISNEEGKEKEEPFKLVSSKKPKEIDIQSKGKAMKGIYELKGDTFRFGFHLKDERPKDFSDDLIIMTFKKKK